MALSPEERRFVKNWEDQRRGGKASFVGTYTFGLFFLLYLTFIALGLFSALPFIKFHWLAVIAVVSLIGAIMLSFFLWNWQQKKFRTIIKREIKAGEEVLINDTKL